MNAIPKTYFSKRYNSTYEVQILTVEPHWACFHLGHKFRCLIGKWNFNCSHFIDQSQANGKTELEAFNLAVKNCETEIVQGNEDAQMLGE